MMNFGSQYLTNCATVAGIWIQMPATVAQLVKYCDLKFIMLWPTLNPETTCPLEVSHPPRPWRQGGAGIGAHSPQGRGTSREKKLELPRGRPVIPKRKGKGQIRRRAHKR
jgi:hypothetical protein